MITLPRPCLDCGTLADNGSRCPACRAKYETQRAARRAPRPHYGGDYARRAKAVRDTATACWICGEGARAGDPWQADHVVPRDPASPLAPAHRSCNIRRASVA